MRLQNRATTSSLNQAFRNVPCALYAVFVLAGCLLNSLLHNLLLALVGLIEESLTL